MAFKNKEMDGAIWLDEFVENLKSMLGRAAQKARAAVGLSRM
ncbi:hypothetical protein [Azospirillum soli]|nr:hypothetical protein [Azospirillum soli]MBP2316920.1 hypothetical protein [Azospirillum soli]